MSFLFLSHNNGIPIEFTRSAARHGIDGTDAIYAMTHAHETQPFTDRHGRRAMLFIGPPHAQTDRLVEVIASISSDTILVYRAIETGRTHHDHP